MCLLGIHTYASDSHWRCLCAKNTAFFLLILGILSWVYRLLFHFNGINLWLLLIMFLLSLLSHNTKQHGDVRFHSIPFRLTSISIRCLFYNNDLKTTIFIWRTIQLNIWNNIQTNSFDIVDSLGIVSRILPRIVMYLVSSNMT